MFVADNNNSLPNNNLGKYTDLSIFRRDLIITASHIGSRSNYNTFYW